jgi:hypothetical protein
MSTANFYAAKIIIINKKPNKVAEVVVKSSFNIFSKCLPYSLFSGYREAIAHVSPKNRGNLQADGLIVSRT